MPGFVHCENQERADGDGHLQHLISQESIQENPGSWISSGLVDLVTKKKIMSEQLKVEMLQNLHLTVVCKGAEATRLA